MEFTATRSSNNASYQNLSPTYTIPADGLYELRARAWCGFAGGTDYDLNIKCLLDSEVLFEEGSITAVPNFAANRNVNFHTTISFWANKGQVIKYQTSISEAKITGKSTCVSRVKRLL